jgi:predicted nucleic acid-binding protein
VKVFLDTSVLVAALVEDHPHNVQAAALLLAAQDGTAQTLISAHSLAEVYAVLTRTPFSPRIYPVEAWQLLEESILAHMQVVALNPAEYRQVVHVCSKNGWIGGAVYDALHIHTAQAAGCERLYTFNLREFRTLAPEEFRHRITAP